MKNGFFELDRIRVPEELRVGMTLYKAYGLGSNSFIQTIKVLSPPYMEEGIGLFFQCESGFDSKASCCDAGITDKPHNNHRSFYSEESAQQYIDNHQLGVTSDYWYTRNARYGCVS